MSVDDMLNASMGMDLDSFLNQSFNEEMLKGLASGMDSEGSYSFDGKTLKFDQETNEMTVSFRDADNFQLDGDDGGVGMFPLDFTRVK